MLRSPLAPPITFILLIFRCFSIPILKRNTDDKSWPCMIMTSCFRSILTIAFTFVFVYVFIQSEQCKLRINQVHHQPFMDTVDPPVPLACSIIVFASRQLHMPQTPAHGNRKGVVSLSLELGFAMPGNSI